MKFSKTFLAGALCVGLAFGCGVAHKGSKSSVHFKKGEAVKLFDQFYANYVKEVAPAYRDAADSYFKASIDSKKENWDKSAACDMKVNALLSRKMVYDSIVAFRESGEIVDPLKKRQLELMYLEFASKQIDTNKLNALSQMNSTIENKYSSFRTQVDGKTYSDNDVEELLKTSTNNEELKNVWTAQKKIGQVVAKDIIDLVKKRNEVAKALGYENYHTMSLTLSEEDPAQIEKLFDELDKLTAPAFAKEKAKMDEILAKKYGIAPNQLMPWNYQNRFFQEAPAIYNVDLDKYFSKVNIEKTTSEYYASIGLPIDDMIARSDLYEKPNKNQHAYCINVDRDALDIRALCNIKPNNNWMGTMLHEFGHALYEKFYAKDLPWNLKTPAHTFTTEAIAMLFGRFATNPVWMQEVIGVPASETAKISEDVKNTLKLQQLVFSRWAQVMYRFEKSLYANPDQDLNKLWWSLVEKYQLLKKPEGRNEPDWASKIHIATSPCYYHNYLLGELLASQLYFTINKKLGSDGMQQLSWQGRKEVGEYLIQNVFSVGAKYKWDEMIKRATGEELTPKYYAKQFVN
jgi:peptidyl-dipeptidase A